jgi:hypothetical protein
LALCWRSKIKSPFFSASVQAVLAVGKNLIPIISPRITAIVVPIPEVIPNQVTKGKHAKVIPIARAILWVIP